eukprot:5732199-Pleurochrysis_carterae.AAC.4
MGTQTTNKSTCYVKYRTQWNPSVCWGDARSRHRTICGIAASTPALTDLQHQQATMLSLVSGSLAFTAPLTPAVTQTRAHAPNMLKSQALPFVEAPKALDGSMVGDVVRCRVHVQFGKPPLRFTCRPAPGSKPSLAFLTTGLRSAQPVRRP